MWSKEPDAFTSLSSQPAAAAAFVRSNSSCSGTEPPLGSTFGSTLPESLSPPASTKTTTARTASTSTKPPP